jgi:hypothetical protein
MGDDGEARQQEQHGESAQRAIEGEGGFEIGGEVACAYDEAAMVVSLCQKSPIAFAWEGPTHQGNSCAFRNMTAPTACFGEGVQGRDVGQLRAQENLDLDDDLGTIAPGGRSRHESLYPYWGRRRTPMRQRPALSHTSTLNTNSCLLEHEFDKPHLTATLVEFL